MGAASAWSRSRVGGLLLLLACANGLEARAADRSVVNLAVPLRTVYPGEVIEAAALGVRAFHRTRVVGGYWSDPAALVGKVARRTLPVGMAIANTAVRDPHAFAEGQQVTLSYRAGGLSITALGSAVQAGVVGQVVAVRNLDTGAVVRGEVQPDGVVVVGGAP